MPHGESTTAVRTGNEPPPGAEVPTSDTVKIRIAIEISSEGEYDTGITVEAWNALTGVQRAKVASDLWVEQAETHNFGGISITTDGAQPI